MDFQEFLEAIDKFGWGLASSNTYTIKKPLKEFESSYDNYIYIQISERGHRGEFEKREFKVSELNKGLDEWFKDFV